MAVVQTYNLNIVPESSPVVVNINQYDKGEGRFVFNLFDGDTPYTPSAGAVGEIQGTKPDGKGFIYYVKSISGSAVTCDLNMQMSAVLGKTRAQLMIHEPTGETGTFVFWIKVQPSALPKDQDISESDYGIIEDMIAAAEQASSQIAFGVENAEAWAIGERDGQPVSPADETYHNNSKYYSEQAAASAASVGEEASDSEAWAKGTRDGDPVETTDPTYHNNSKYYSEVSDGFSEDSEAYAKGTRDGVAVTSGDPAYNNNSKYWADDSQSSSEDSEAYAVGTRAGTSVTSGDPAYHNNAKYYAEDADDSAEDSEAYAVGKRDGADVTSGDPAYHNNSKYYAGEASTSATNAGLSETAAEGSAEDSEAYAVGKRGGTDVSSSDPAYHNNSKYYSGEASTSAAAAALSETAADDSAEDSEAWAVGQRGGVDVPSTDPTYHNNAKYWSQQAAGQSFAGLDDVDINTSTLANGQVPTYNSQTQKWENGSGNISSKADKVTGATTGNFAGLDASGNLTDSGSKASDFKLASAHEAWSDVTSKPFSTVSTGLTVTSDALTADIQDFGTTGTASASAVSYQRIKKSGSWYEIKGTKYMETSTKTTANSVDTFTFTNAAILTTSAIDVYADVYGVAPTTVTVSSGSCAVSFSSSDNVTTCRIYIK